MNAIPIRRLETGDDARVALSVFELASQSLLRAVATDPPLTEDLAAVVRAARQILRLNAR